MLYKKNLTINYLKKFYFGNNGSISNASMDQLANLLGDENFVRGIHKVAQYQVENSSAPTYLYKFTYKEETTLLEALINKSYKGNIFKYYLFLNQSYENNKKFYRRWPRR